MAVARPLVTPGAIIHFPYDFGPPEGIHPKFLLVVDCQIVFYRMFAINTNRTEWQEETAERMAHVLTIDQQSHRFLDRDSYVNCTQLLPEKVRIVDQYLRENPRETRGRISARLRDEILAVIGGSRRFSADDKQAITRSLRMA